MAAYHDRVNPDLLRVIPRTAGCVLEIGCGAGALGAAFKRRAPQCRWIGVELDADAAAQARGRIDHVVAGDAQALAAEQLGVEPGGADAVIYGDVLEHMADPWSVVKRHAALLAEGGLVLACIPNVAHWSVLRELLQGKWTYAEEGLLDRTHLRFFTLEGIRALFEGAGLVVHDVRPRVFHRERARAFAKALAPALAALGIEREAFFARSTALQYIVRAGRKPADRPLLLQAMTLAPVAACNDVRVALPCEALATQPGVRVAIKERGAELHLGDGVEDKIFLWQRPILRWSDSLPSLRRLIERGYVIVVEFDDHPKVWPEIAANDYLNYRGAHAVQTATEELAALFRDFNPEVALFPNAIDELPPLRSRDGPEVTLFFGALNREKDWAPFMPALNAALRAAGERVSVTVVHDRAFHDALATGRKRFHPTLPYADYLRLLGSADISLLPLREDEFTRMKSDLKFIESAAHGAVALASPTVYARTLRDGVTGMIFRTAEEFGERLRALIADPMRRRALAAAAWDYVRRERMLSSQIGRRLAWYRELCSRREELTRRLRERVPQLA